MKGTSTLIAAVIAAAIALNGLADAAVSHHSKGRCLPKVEGGGTQSLSSHRLAVP
ncbi:MAG: hypothetical protein ACXVRH_12020 [Thermoleophilaceae bacterium]